MPSSSPLFLSFVLVAAGFGAGIVPLFFTWSHSTAHRWIAFGAGCILGAAFLHMIPEAYELAGASSLPTLLLGFLLLYSVEQFTFPHHPHEEEAGEFHEIGFLAFLGICVHDLIDGITLGSGHHVPRLTPVIFLALVLHKIPMTFSLSLLMLHGGFSTRKIIAFLGILLFAIPLGVVMSTYLVAFLGTNQEKTLGRLIDFSAGTFIYIAAYELLPEMHRKSGPGSRIGIFFLLGLAVMFLLKLIHPVV